MFTYDNPSYTMNEYRVKKEIKRIMSEYSEKRQNIKGFEFRIYEAMCANKVYDLVERFVKKEER
jgi:hypothetical protein